MIRPVRADGRIDAGGVFTPIYRPRVVDRIAAAAQQRVVLIVAPAGYGKSTALRQYLESANEPYVRYDLHADNANLLGFMRGFADAIGDIAPDARATVTSAYESAHRSPTPGADLALWMHAHLKAHAGLVAIDDLHIAEEEPEVSKFLTSLIDRTKGRIRWILASRSYLELPVGSWLAYQEMDLAVDEADLRFTPEEARDTAKASNVRVREEELSELLDLTDGWPTALSFALRSSTRSLDLRNVRANTRDLVYRYLAEQVYNTLSDREREVLSLAALMPRIDLSVLQHAGYDDALASIEDLRNRAAFITPDKSQPGIYHCHDLFRDFVRYQIGLEGDTALRSTHAKVGAAYEAAGDLANALLQYADSGDAQTILRILDEHGFALMEQGNGDILSRAIDSLDAATRATAAMPLAIRGLIDASAGRYDQAESLLKRAADRARDPEQRAQMLLPVCRIAANRGNNDTAVLRSIEEDEQVSVDSRSLAAALALVLQLRTGQHEGARAKLDKILDAAQVTTSPVTRIRLLQLMGPAASDLGDLALGRDLFAAVAESASERGLHSIASRAFSGLSVNAGLYDHDAARNLWYAQQAAVSAAKGGEILDIQTTSLIMLGAEIRRGSPQQIIQLEQQLAQLRLDPFRLAFVGNSTAIRYGWEARFEDAYRTMAPAWPRQSFASDRAVSGSYCALFAAASGRNDQAKTIVAEVIKIVDREIPTEAAPYGDIAALFCALAEAVAGRQTAAQKILKRNLSSSHKYIESLSRIIAHAVRTLKSKVTEPESFAVDVEVLKDSGYGGYALTVQTIIDHFGAVNVRAPSDIKLTPTEIQILGQLSLGLAPKEIAEESGRSVNTVQVHIQNAIEKLGCHGRTEAIVVAKRLGLLAG